MHDLTPLTALGGALPRRDVFPDLVIAEVPFLPLASVAARQGHTAVCAERLSRFLGVAPPPPGQVSFGAEYACFWTGPEQWMVDAAPSGPEDIADLLKSRMQDAASVTEQSDGWAAFDLSGPPAIDMLERLCPLPARRMQRGDATRTTIDHLGCFALCLETGQHFRILGPRSAAASLVHALVTAARAVT